MTIKINVKGVGGEKVEIELESNEAKVSELKAAIQEKTGIPAGEQRLIFAGHVLKDENTLAAHNIKDSGIAVNMVRAAPKKPEPVAEAEPARQGGRGSHPGVAEARAMLGDPQTAALFLQLLQNPELLQQAARDMPELATPEFQQALNRLRTDPAALRQFVEAMQEDDDADLHEFTAEELSQALQSAMTTLNIDPSPPSKPVTADEFKTAFGNAVTALHQQAGGRREGGAPRGQQPRRERPEHRFITKEFLQQCLNNVMRNL